MSNNVPLKLYKAIVPPWLVEVFTPHELPTSTLLNFRLLESILSKEDVCFYYCYNNMSDDMLDNKVQDFISIAALPINMEWAEENKDLLAKIVKQCDLQYLMEQHNADTKKTDLATLCVNFVPQVADDNVLVFLGQEKPAFRSKLEFYDAAVQELHKLTSFESLKQLALFDAYVQCDRL